MDKVQPVPCSNGNSYGSSEQELRSISRWTPNTSNTYTIRVSKSSGEGTHKRGWCRFQHLFGGKVPPLIHHHLALAKVFWGQAY